MKGFILSLRSEFYKSRKTMGFWCAVILPLLIVGLMFIGFLTHPGGMSKFPGMALWMFYVTPISMVMGNLLLPMYIIFASYSVNAMEHKADTWKTLFSLPISKWSVYAAKYFYAMFLVFLCLLLFYLLLLGSGNLLGVLKPELKFYDFHIEGYLLQVYCKLFLVSLGILSIQFLLSLVWSDFLKPMGIGFVCTIASLISVGVGWQYAYFVPYAHPALAMKGLNSNTSIIRNNKGVPQLTVDMFTKEVWVSLIVAAAIFILGFFIVQKKSVK
ncbi:ABC transporter permease [Mucilaginibacter sp. AW1-3]